MMIVPTLCVGMPPRTLRVRSGMWRRCVPKLQRYPRHALGLLNSQSVPFVTRSVTGGMPTRSDGHDQCRDGLVYNDECSAWECRSGRSASRLHAVAEHLHDQLLAFRPGYIDLLRVYPLFLPPASLWDTRPVICRNKQCLKTILQADHTLGLPD